MHVPTVYLPCTYLQYTYPVLGKANTCGKGTWWCTHQCTPAVMHTCSNAHLQYCTIAIRTLEGCTLVVMHTCNTNTCSMHTSSVTLAVMHIHQALQAMHFLACTGRCNVELELGQGSGVRGCVLCSAFLDMKIGLGLEGSEVKCYPS